VVEKNGEFRLVVVDDKGNPRTTKTPGSGDDMSVAEYLAGMRADDEFKALFLSDAKPGNGTPPGGGGGGGGSTAGVVSRSDPLAITAAAEDLANGKAKLG
jgi:hypothetical protein